MGAVLHPCLVHMFAALLQRAYCRAHHHTCTQNATLDREAHELARRLADKGSSLEAVPTEAAGSSQGPGRQAAGPADIMEGLEDMARKVGSQPRIMHFHHHSLRYLPITHTISGNTLLATLFQTDPTQLNVV